MRKSIETSDDGYLERLPHGAQSAYVRAVVDLHLADCREAVLVLRGAGHGDEGIIDLLRAADAPAARYHETDLATLRPEAREAVGLLWHEAELSGLDGAALLAALEGAHA